RRLRHRSIREFFPDAEAVALALDAVARDGKGRRSGDRLARAQAEAGVVPWAANRIADDQPFRERAAVMRAVRAYRHDLGADAAGDDTFSAHLAAVRRSGLDLRDVRPLPEIGTLRRLVSTHELSWCFSLPPRLAASHRRR